MRHMEICRRTTSFENSSQMTVVYYVTADELPQLGAGAALEIYGIGITILESSETEIIPNVTFSKDDIISLAELLARHLVTPVTLCDVVSDWVCQAGCAG